MATTTAFRRAVRDAIAEALGVSTVVERRVDAALVDQSAACAWPVGESRNPDNAHFRIFSFVVRVILPSDPAVGVTDDERPDLLESLAEQAREALPEAPSSLGVADVWIYELDEIEYDLDRVSVDFSFSAEFACGC